MTDPIRDALEAAACALCREAKSCRDDCGGKCAWREADVNMPACAAAAVAAFNRRIAEHFRERGRISDLATAIELEDIAAAVERAAKEGA